LGQQRRRNRIPPKRDSHPVIGPAQVLEQAVGQFPAGPLHRAGRGDLLQHPGGVRRGDLLADPAGDEPAQRRMQPAGDLGAGPARSRCRLDHTFSTVE